MAIPEGFELEGLRLSLEGFHCLILPIRHEQPFLRRESRCDTDLERFCYVCSNGPNTCKSTVHALSRRRWSPAKIGPPGTSTGAVIGPPLPRMVPSHETLHALVFRRNMVSQQFISVFSTAGHNLHARSMVYRPTVLAPCSAHCALQ